MMSQIAICIDGADTVFSMDTCIRLLNGKIVGQRIRRDGMPLVIVEFPDKTDLEAEINRRKLESHYSPERIAA